MLASYPHSRVTSSTAAIYGGNRRRGGAIAHRDGAIIHGGDRIGRTGGYLGPFMRRLTPQVVVQAGRPHCHLSGPAAQERVTTTSKGTHANIPRPADRITGLMYRRCPHEDASRCHHLLYRLSRTRKPTSHATSNTQCPITPPRATPDMKKAPPQECLFKNAEPPPVDRTEGGRCAPGGTRTPNLLNRNQMLYPLSYGRCAVWLSISLHASHRDAKSNDVA